MKGGGRAIPILTRLGRIFHYDGYVRQKMAIATLCPLWRQLSDTGVYGVTLYYLWRILTDSLVIPKTVPPPLPTSVSWLSTQHYSDKIGNLKRRSAFALASCTYLLYGENPTPMFRMDIYIKKYGTETIEYCKPIILYQCTFLQILYSSMRNFLGTNSKQCLLSIRMTDLSTCFIRMA